MKLEFFYSSGVFIVKMLMKLGPYLSGLHGTHLSLKRLVVFTDIHFMILACSILDLIMLIFWCDMCNSSDHNANSCAYYACYLNMIYPYLYLSAQGSRWVNFLG